MLPPARSCVRQQPGGHVDPLDAAAQHQEQPALVAAHRGVGQPGHHRAPLPHPAEERVHALLLDPAAGVRQAVPGGVEALPHLRGDRLPGAAGVLPGRGQRADHRAGVALVQAEQADHPGRGERARRPAARPSPRAATGRPRPRWSTGRRASAAGARRGCGRCPRPARRSGRSSRATRRSGSASTTRPAAVVAAVAAESADAGARARVGARRRRQRRRVGGQVRHLERRRCPPAPASTQVSLEPPPWLELTTSAPSGSATRVSPPGSTQIFSPSLTANGRRSTCRPRSRLPISVGTIDSFTSRWAIQPRGSATILRASPRPAPRRWPASRSRCPRRRSRRPA